MKGWLAVLVCTTSLAGCLSGEPTDGLTELPDAAFFDGIEGDFSMLSQPVHDILPVVEEWVVSSDGQRMHNAVYRPDTDEPVPVFVNFSPYWGNTAEMKGDGFAKYLIENFVPRGYAVVLSAVRGTGHSEGCFQVAGDLEIQDAYDVIDHYANADWSNGHIGTGGKSYDSTTQNGLIAKNPHPALKAAFHVSGITDMYRYNYREGSPYANGLAFTPRYFLTQTFDENAEGNMAPDAFVRMLDDIACPEFASHVASGTGSAVLGLKDAYWQERDWTQSIADSSWNGSLFFVHGFQDWNVKPDNILPWVQLLPESIDVVGWLHQDTYNSGHVYPMRTDWNATMLRWLDETLKGIDTGLERGFSLQGSDGLWRSSEAWPPEPTPVEVDGPILASAVDIPLRYSGQMTITLDVDIQNPDGVLVVGLYDESPDGTLTWTNEALLRTMYHEGLSSPDLAVGPLRVTASFYPQDDVLEIGHRWVLAHDMDSQHAIVLPSQTAGLAVDFASATVNVPWASAGVGNQPLPTYCHAC